ncbi:cyclic nucleotide-binding domain-containing protein [Rhizobium sp. CC-YZS058]|uniref:cyclic nucleotide-binding domain-containing protein n=1 Tax=Rhizobium sp. CC-YZS058 TaxID=3042153 RepID=UPI002B057D33|nr:cyclic nucleotide-binding domain-containing protein [Rhizobium sp. CC-YZS058]MEA3536552.1 cyclic nucleotide-binding domain-containing protein [Rhizobium sp. CC-YZS058]
MALNDDIALLSAVPLFADLDADKLRLIAFGAEHKRLARGQQLFREGAPADCAYVVASGQVSLSRIASNGATERVATASPGVLLSELAMISFVERKFTAIADEDCDVLRIPRSLFHRMLEEYPDVARLVESRIRENLQAMIRDIQRMAPRFSD